MAEVNADPEVTHFETNAMVVASEVPSGITLNQSPLEILDSTTDRARRPFSASRRGRDTPASPPPRPSDSASAHATVTGAGIVAIIDTGVDPTHPMLAGVLVPGHDFTTDTAGQDPSGTTSIRQPRRS